MSSLPDLTDYALVLTFQGLHTTDAQLHALVERLAAEGSALGLFRAAVLGYRLHPRPHDNVESWLREAYLQGNRTEQIMAMATMMHLQVNEPFLAGVADSRTSVDAISTLESLLREVHDLPAGRMRLETELRVTHALFQANLTLGNTSPVDLLSARLLQIASLFNIPTLTDTYRRMRAYASLASAQYHRGASLYAQLLSEERPGSKHFENLSSLTARAFVNLGALPAAIEILEAAVVVSPENMEVAGWLQWMRAISGKEDVHAPVALGDEWRERYGWQVQAMQAFAAADQDVPLGKALKGRDEHLRRVLRLSEHGLRHNRVSSDTLFDRWIRGRARLLLGEYGAAAQEVTGLVTPEPEDLLNRTLLAALHLDLAMTPLQVLPVPLVEAEMQLREAFDLMRSLAYADQVAMAALVMRWHPQAAAYAALMPDPIAEFLPALDLMVRAGSRSTWQGKAVPPKFVSHMVRFGLRLQPEAFPLGGNMAFQVSKLSTSKDSWGPLVSALPVAVALLRGGTVHRVMAQKCLQEYGGVPEGSELGLVTFQQVARSAAVGEVDLPAVWAALAWA